MRRTLIAIVAVAALTLSPMGLGAVGIADEEPVTIQVPTSHIPEDAEVTRDPETGETTVTLATSSDDLADIGRTLGPFEGEEPMVNLAVLPNGKVMYYSGIESDRNGDGDTDLQFMWQSHPEHGRSRLMTLDVHEDGTITHTVQTPDPETAGPEDLFCSGTTIAPDGRVVTTGATEYHTLDEDPPENTYDPLIGLNTTRFYDVDDDGGTWTYGPDMGAERWYPSAIQLPDGRTLVASGINTLFMPQTHNYLVETYDPANPAAGWQELDTSLEGIDTDDEVPERPETGVRWIDDVHEEIPNLPMYPRIYVVPGGPHEGEVFYSTAGDYWGPFGEHPLEGIWSLQQTLDLETGEWSIEGPSVFGGRQLGVTVPLMVSPDDGYAPSYLTFGGTLQRALAATATSEIADLSADEITTAATESMHLPRWSHNGVLLPDGTVLAVGGSTFDNVLMHGAPSMSPHNLERYVPGDEPGTGSWELLAPLNNVRGYHSSAALLPDGRVLIGGHVPLPAFHHQQRENGNPQPYDDTFEVYEPPYMFAADTRPKILGATGAVSYSGTITIEADDITDEGGLDSVVLIRPGATTHGFDADQRGIELDVLSETQLPSGTTSITVQAPPNANVAPPGNYMLFVNEDVGGTSVPSEASWLNLQPTA